MDNNVTESETVTQFKNKIDKYNMKGRAGGLYKCLHFLCSLNVVKQFLFKLRMTHCFVK